jgi:GNAT superfamily N-acetyltransferase
LTAEIRIALEEGPLEVDVKAVTQGLIDHAAGSGVEPRRHQALTVLARDERGTVIGGLVGDTVWGWLQVKEFWVADGHRGCGYGTKLLGVAEREAVRRGCHHALLDTFDFQAREFYEKLGYAVFGSLADFPRTHTRFFMSKTLVNVSPAS